MLRLVNVLAALFIARFYGSAVLGAYAASLAAVTVIVMFSDNGLQTFAITSLRGAPAVQAETATRIYAAKTILLAFAILVFASVAAGLKLTPFLWALGALVSVRMVLQSYSQLQIAFLKALLRANIVGKLQFLHGLFLVTGVAVAALRGWTVLQFVAWFALGQLLETLLTLAAVRYAGLRMQLPRRLSVWNVIKQSFPLGVTYGLANLIVRLDTIVLSWFVPLAVLGVFSAANSILLIVYVVAWLLGSVLLPEFLRVRVVEKELTLLVKSWTRWIAAASLPMALIICFLAPKLISLLFGPRFAQSAILASVMALAIPFILLNSVYTSFAVAIDRRDVFLPLFAFTAAATIALDIVLGRAFGPIGVSAAIVLREAGMFIGFLIWMPRRSARLTELGYHATS